MLFWEKAFQHWSGLKHQYIPSRRLNHLLMIHICKEELDEIDKKLIIKKESHLL